MHNSLTRSAVVLASFAIGGCKSTVEPDKVRQARPDPAALVAKAIGKAHVPPTSPWGSRAECERALERAKATRIDTSTPRVANWNVRYFPDGSEHGPEDRQTDLDWLACAIALLDVDVLAVQEFKENERARASAVELIRKLNALTGRSYELELADCDRRDVQHPGFFYDTKQVSATLVRDIPELNPEPQCSNSASPGFAAYLEFKAGPDFHFVVVHAYAGGAKKEHGRRQTFLGALDRVTAQLSRSGRDTDVLVTGDFNTSGCSDCEPAVTSKDETSSLAKRVAGFRSPLRLVPASESCTFVLRNEPVLLDHFLASTSMKETPAAALALVSGYCGVAKCRDVFPDPQAERRLSDHCPLVLELSAEDLD